MRYLYTEWLDLLKWLHDSRLDSLLAKSVKTQYVPRSFRELDTLKAALMAQIELEQDRSMVVRKVNRLPTVVHEFVEGGAVDCASIMKTPMPLMLHSGLCRWIQRINGVTGC